jgi:hypothetical protein
LNIKIEEKATKTPILNSFFWEKKTMASKLRSAAPKSMILKAKWLNFKNCVAFYSHFYKKQVKNQAKIPNYAA